MNLSTVNETFGDDFTICFNAKLPVLEITDHVQASLIITCILNTIFALISIIANTSVLLVISRVRSLQCCSNIYLACLAATDMLTSLLSQPLFTVRRIQELNQQLDCTLVIVYQSISALCVTSSYLTLTCLTWDRYLALFWSLQYKTLMSPPRVFCSFAGVWVCSSILVLTRTLVQKESVLYAVSGSVLLACVCFIIIIYCKIFNLSRRINAEISSQDNVSSSTVHQLRETRVARTVARVLCAVAICYLPWFIVSAVATIHGVTQNIYIIFTWVDTIVFMNSCLNPVIYFLSNNHLRAALLRMTGLRRNGVAPESSLQSVQ